MFWKWKQKHSIWKILSVQMYFMAWIALQIMKMVLTLVPRSNFPIINKKVFFKQYSRDVYSAYVNGCLRYERCMNWLSEARFWRGCLINPQSYWWQMESHAFFSTCRLCDVLNTYGQVFTGRSTAETEFLSCRWLHPVRMASTAEGLGTVCARAERWYNVCWSKGIELPTRWQGALKKREQIRTSRQVVIVAAVS